MRKTMHALFFRTVDLWGLTFKSILSKCHLRRLLRLLISNFFMNACHPRAIKIHGTYVRDNLERRGKTDRVPWKQRHCRKYSELCPRPEERKQLSVTVNHLQVDRASFPQYRLQPLSSALRESILVVKKSVNESRDVVEDVSLKIKSMKLQSHLIQS